jgi:hypothetical protein
LCNNVGSKILLTSHRYKPVLVGQGLLAQVYSARRFSPAVELANCWRPLPPTVGVLSLSNRHAAVTPVPWSKLSTCTGFCSHGMFNKAMVKELPWYWAWSSLVLGSRGHHTCPGILHLCHDPRECTAITLRCHAPSCAARLSKHCTGANSYWRSHMQHHNMLCSPVISLVLHSHLRAYHMHKTVCDWYNSWHRQHARPLVLRSFRQDYVRLILAPLAAYYSMRSHVLFTCSRSCTGTSTCVLTACWVLSSVLLTVLRTNARPLVH